VECNIKEFISKENLNIFITSKNLLNGGALRLRQ
jgi:hypothetical protein